MEVHHRQPVSAVRSGAAEGDREEVRAGVGPRTLAFRGFREAALAGLRGIGKETARRLVVKFGTQAIEVVAALPGEYAKPRRGAKFFVCGCGSKKVKTPGTSARLLRVYSFMERATVVNS